MMRTLLKKNSDQNKGFSLIELMVAVTIFSIVMVISIGAILTIVDGNKKNQTMQIAINNLNYAVESMTRSIKTGYAYDVGGAITGEGGACSSIELNISEDLGGVGGDDRVTYYLDEFGGGNTNVGLRLSNPEIDYDGFITSPDLDITELCFRKTDTGQPAISIVIRGVTTGGKEGLSTAFNLYTSVTQRQVQYDN